MPQARKLATIMSVDIAGYSRSAERDEDAAAEGVGRLKHALSEVASAVGGRIFSTAGDGMMLEFPTASAGLAAAQGLMKRADLPRARIGLHVGEVIVDGDDLLGHGVNVAARLQALAAPGAAMISQSMRAQAHDSAEFTLTPRGRVQLNKMEETIEVFELAPRGQQVSTSPDWRRFRPAIVVGAGVLMLVVLGVLAVGTVFRPANAALESPTVTVLPFASLNADADGQFYAESISSSVANALSATGLRVVSPASAGDQRSGTVRGIGAQYVVDGEVRRESDLIRVTVRIDDGGEAVTIRSEAFEAPVAEATELPARIATRIAGYAWTLQVTQSGGANAELAAGLIRTLELRDRGDLMAAYHAARDLSRAYPNEPMAQFLHGLCAGYAYWEIPEVGFPEAIAEARESARRAHRLAPHFGEAYSADYLLAPRHELAAREAVLRRGLDVDPNAPSLSMYLSYHLNGVGRASDAEPLMAAAVALDPFNREKATLHLRTLLVLGQRTDSQTLLERVQRLWPNDRWIAPRRFFSSSFEGNPSDAQIILDDPELGSTIEPTNGPQPTRLMLRAVASRSERDIEAARQACENAAATAFGDTRSAGATTFSDMTCLIGLTMLGDLDRAFERAEIDYPEGRRVTRETEADIELRQAARGRSWGTLFRAEMAPFRADPRFVPLAERLGLLEYWRIPGNEPDFCATERAPVCDLL